MLPHPPQLDGTDSHLYFGWYQGDERDLPGFARAPCPAWRGSSSSSAPRPCPSTPTFCEPERWPDLDWDRLGRTPRAAEARCSTGTCRPPTTPTFDAWRDATQAYQAELIRHHVEALRRLKYRPTGGFAQFCFADGQPAVTWSVLDHDRAPKARLRGAARRRAAR